MLVLKKFFFPGNVVLRELIYIGFVHNNTHNVKIKNHLVAEPHELRILKSLFLIISTVLIRYNKFVYIS